MEPDQILFAALSASIVDGRLAGRVATGGLEVSFRVAGTPVDPEGVELEDVTGAAQVWVFVE